MPIDKSYFRPGEAAFDYEKDLGDPGKFPYARGLYESGYGTHLPTIRPFAGLGTALHTNKRFKLILGAGATGLSTALDLVTLYGRDSDDPLSRGQVGWDGVAIDTVADVNDLFDGIPIDTSTVSITDNASAAIVFAMYIGNAMNRGIPLASLGGTMQSDILKEHIAQKEWRYPLVRGLDLVTDMAEFTTEHMPKWNWVSVSGYHIREAGSTAVQELAYTLADGIAYVEDALRRGLPLERFASRISFFFDVHNRMFEEVAKLRAARILWAKIMRDRFGAKEGSREGWCRMHIQTAGCTLSRAEPENNIARVAYQLLTGILGGAQSVHPNSFDEVLCTPTEKALRVAIRTLQILLFETGISEYVDPLGGAYQIEHLTQQIVREAGAEIERITEMGGMLRAIELGYPQAQIRNSALAQEESYNTGTIIRVGENKFQSSASNTEQGNIFKELEERRGYEKLQLERLAKVKSARDEHAVRLALDLVRKTAMDREHGLRVNMMDSLIKASLVYATIGEMSNAMEDAWGKYMETEIFAPRSRQMLPKETIDKYRLAYPMRILLAKGGLDGHDRPIYTLAELFKNLGAEVILPGLQCPAEDIARRALEEDVDVIGISTHTGAPVVLMGDMKEQLRVVGKSDALLIGGGIIRDHERRQLAKIGIEHFFAGDTSFEDIARVLHDESLKRKADRRLRKGAGDHGYLAKLLTRVAQKPRMLSRYLGASDIPNGNAHVVGITGSTAIGKSTLIDKMVATLREDNLRVVVLAIDPTEEGSGGAILGDIIRMRRHYADQGVFMRSFGSHGAAGSVTKYLNEVVAVARRFTDVVIVETVGAGQADTVLKSAVDTFVSLPDSRGDMVNLLKSGHHRHADILVVNKRAELPEEKNFAELVRNFTETKNGWTPPVFSVNAQTGDGVADFVRKGLYAHQKFLKSPDKTTVTK